MIVRRFFFDVLGVRNVARFAAASACVATAFFVAASSNAADVVRYLVKTDTGAYEERSAEGTITAVSPDGVSLDAQGKNAPDANPIPTERVVWLQFQDAPMNLAAARVETEVGAWEEALEKLDDIGADDLDREKYPTIAAEVDWYRAYAALQLALNDAGSFKDGGSAMAKFVKEHSDSYRYYEAQQALGAAYYAMSERQTKKESKQDFLKRARDSYAVLENAASEEIQARGKLGLAKVAFDLSEFDEAKKLFGEVAERTEFDVESSEAKAGLARTSARQGDVDEAVRILNELLEETPNDATLRQARIYNALGDVYADANRPYDAVLAYLHVDLLYPAARTERVAALKALVGQWRKLDREDRAQETIERLRDRFHVDVR